MLPSQRNRETLNITYGFRKYLRVDLQASENEIHLHNVGSVPSGRLGHKLYVVLLKNCNGQLNPDLERQKARNCYFNLANFYTTAVIRIIKEEDVKGISAFVM